MKLQTIVFLGVAAVSVAVAQSASAAFMGVSVAPVTIANGRYVYSVYANFSLATDQIVKVKNWQVTSGTMQNVQHSDTALPLGSWNPNWTTAESGAALSDSYVSITGLWNDQSTQLNWTNGGPTIAAGAAWGLPALSSGGVVVGSTLKVKIMQIAGTYLLPTVFQFSASMEVEWRASSATPTQSGDSTLTLPAPPALVVAALGLLVNPSQRKRRQ